MQMIRLIALSAIFLIQGVLYAQYYDCNSEELSKLESDLAKAPKTYDRILADLSSGLFCSQCKKTKTEIETTMNISFQEHLEDVQGQAISAPPELFENAKREYERNVKNISTKIETIEEQCAKAAAAKQKAEEDLRIAEEESRLAEAEEERRLAEAEEERRLAEAEEERRLAEALAEQNRENVFNQNQAFLDQAIANKNKIESQFNQLDNLVDQNTSRLDDIEFVDEITPSIYTANNNAQNNSTSSYYKEFTSEKIIALFDEYATSGNELLRKIQPLLDITLNELEGLRELARNGTEYLVQDKLESLIPEKLQVPYAWGSHIKTNIESVSDMGSDAIEGLERALDGRLDIDTIEDYIKKDVLLNNLPFVGSSFEWCSASDTLLKKLICD